MKKALEYAIILTTKHKSITLKIGDSCRYDFQKDLRKKQLLISEEIVQFLEEIQEYKDLLLLDEENKTNYNYLVKYYAQYIYNRINKFQIKKDLISMESKVNIENFNDNYSGNSINNLDFIQTKMDNYYQLFK